MRARNEEREKRESEGLNLHFCCAFVCLSLSVFAVVTNREQNALLSLSSSQQHQRIRAGGAMAFLTFSLFSSDEVKTTCIYDSWRLSRVAKEWKREYVIRVGMGTREAGPIFCWECH